MDRLHRFAPVAIAVSALLTACDQATVEDGIEIEVAVFGAMGPQACAEGVTAGTEGASFCTDAGERIDLINGITAPFLARAVPCPTVTGWLLDTTLPAAHAHGGHVSAPPGTFDAVEAIGTELSLGFLPAAPGRYCGVELSFERLPASMFGDSVPMPRDDIVLYTRPCHFPNPAPEPPASNHHCYTVPVRGLPASVELEFAGPMTVDAGSRSLHVGVLVDFARWFNGIDFATLEADAEQQQQILQNVLDSVHVVHIGPGNVHDEVP